MIDGNAAHRHGAELGEGIQEPSADLRAMLFILEPAPVAGKELRRRLGEGHRRPAAYIFGLRIIAPCKHSTIALRLVAGLRQGDIAGRAEPDIALAPIAD